MEKTKVVFGLWVLICHNWLIYLCVQVEAGPPRELLNDSNSKFAGLVRASHSWAHLQILEIDSGFGFAATVTEKKNWFHTLKLYPDELCHRTFASTGRLMGLNSTAYCSCRNGRQRDALSTDLRDCGLHRGCSPMRWRDTTQKHAFNSRSNVSLHLRISALVELPMAARNSINVIAESNFGVHFWGFKDLWKSRSGPIFCHGAH